MTETIISPKTNPIITPKTLWQKRELLLFFVLKDVILRYRYTTITLLWTVLQPVSLTIIFVLLFSPVATTFAGKTPYVPFVLLGVIFWSYFVSSLNRASASLVINQPLITKVYFPRIILPLSNMFVGLLDFVLLIIVLLLVLLYLRLPFSVLLFPVLLFSLTVTFFTAFGMSLLFSVLQVRFRDARNILPFITTLLFFVTPVFYSTRLLLPNDQLWIQYFANPLSGAIESIRSVLFQQSFSVSHMLLSLCGSIVYFSIGFVYFQRFEKKLADEL